VPWPRTCCARDPVSWPRTCCARDASARRTGPRSLQAHGASARRGTCCAWDARGVFWRAAPRHGVEPAARGTPAESSGARRLGMAWNLLSSKNTPHLASSKKCKSPTTTMVRTKPPSPSPPPLAKSFAVVKSSRDPQSLLARGASSRRGTCCARDAAGARRRDPVGRRASPMRQEQKRFGGL
jgi:hypothetical protein